ncbi:MAG: SufD family Fe-S cluster assembly protein [Kosmotogaceae bacterium]
MERVIDRIHDDMEMLEPYSDQLSLGDYGSSELNTVIKKAWTENSTFRRNRFFEYQSLGFPDWKKISLKDLHIPSWINNLSAPINIEGKGDFKPVNEMSHSERKMFEGLDFEGSDRKILLLADVFHSNGYIFKGFETTLKISTETDTNFPSYITNLFIIPENSDVKIHLENNSEGLQVMNNRFLLQNNSRLEILFSGVTDKNAFSFINNFYMLEDGSELKIMDFNITDGTTVPHHFILSKGKKSKANIIPAFFAANRGQIDSQYVIKLFGKESHGIINGIGMLKDFTKAVFRPSVHIVKEARGVIGKEQSNIIMLSDSSHALAIPGLFVTENEVEAFHSATVGTVNEDHLYYLMSRGYSLNEAKKMIVVAMFGTFFNEIKSSFNQEYERLKDDIAKRID